MYTISSFTCYRTYIFSHVYTIWFRKDLIVQHLCRNPQLLGSSYLLLKYLSSKNLSFAEISKFFCIFTCLKCFCDLKLKDL